MVRTVMGDETHVQAFVDRQLDSGITLQIGLCIGRLGGGLSRDCVFALVPCPRSSEGQDVVFLEGQSNLSSRESEKKKGSKGRSAPQALQIDVDWVVEHARQVSKMLVGGIKVVGFYILASESTFKISTALLWQVSKLVAATVNTNPLDEFLLLHFSYSPRRDSCRSCNFTSGFGTTSLHPCDWKMGKVLSSLYSLSCVYNFETRIPIYANKSLKERLYEILLSTLSLEAAYLKLAIVSTNGSVVSDDKTLFGEKNREVDIFLPLDTVADVQNGEVTGLVILSGSVQAYAYAFARDPLSHAVTDLKADIINSLRSRLEILYDEVQFSSKDDGNTMTSTDGETLHPLQRIGDSKEYRCKLPCRVFVQWLEGILLSDYMQEHETVQDTNGRCEELFGIEKAIDESGVVDREHVNPILRDVSFWEIANQKSLMPEAESSNVGMGKIASSKVRSIESNLETTTATGAFSTRAILSVIVILVACLVAYVLSMATNTPAQ